MSAPAIQHRTQENDRKRGDALMERGMPNIENSRWRLGGAMAWWVWSLAVAFVVYLFSVQTGYAIVSAQVQKDLVLSASQVAAVAAMYTWVFALFQFFGGALLDQLGSRKILPASIGLVT